MKKCRHDLKIEIMVNFFRPETKKFVRDKMKMSPKKLNTIIDELVEKKLLMGLSNKENGMVYRTTPKGRKIVKLYRDLVIHLDGDEVIPHVFGVYR